MNLSSTSTLTSLTSTLTSLADALLESDSRYFEFGAEVEVLPGADLAWMPGLEQLPAGCVVQRVDSSHIADAEGWLLGIEQQVASIGSPLVRLYLVGNAPVLEAGLRRRGYRPRTEIAYLARGRLPGRRPMSSCAPLHPATTGTKSTTCIPAAE